MTPRERVTSTLSHREPDRVPIGIGASGSAIHDAVYRALKDRLHIEGEIEPFRRGHGDNYYDDRVFDALGTDVRHVFLNFYHSDHFVRKELGAGGLYDPFVDAWGITRETKGGLHAFTGNPLAKATTISDIDGYPWPNPYGDSGLLEGVKERGEYLRHHTAFAVATRSPTSGIFEHCWVLRGMENFMVDMIADPKLAIRLVDRVTDTIMRYYDVLLTAVGSYVDIVETQDDYGTQQNSFMSPELFRKMIKPARQRLHELIRSKAPQARIYLHSCGSIRNLIPDLIELGVDILNPVQPLAAGMDPAELKANFGEKLVFHGAIDMQQAMPGSLEDVSREVRTRIRQLAPGGGYILAPANLVQSDVPLDNLLRMVEDAKRYGRYPIAV
nr:uroporphyrinogen decarboxylase [Chloroflexota bacterium]